MAWAQRSSGLIKSGGKCKHFLRDVTLIKVDNVSWKRILINNIESLLDIIMRVIVMFKVNFLLLRYPVCNGLAYFFNVKIPYY